MGHVDTAALHLVERYMYVFLFLNLYGCHTVKYFSQSWLRSTHALFQVVTVSLFVKIRFRLHDGGTRWRQAFCCVALCHHSEQVHMKPEGRMIPYKDHAS